MLFIYEFLFDVSEIDNVLVDQTIKDVYEALEEKGYNPLSYRLMCLQSHYRKQLVFTFENLDNAEQTYKKLKQKTLNLSNDGAIDEDKFDMYNKKFISFLDDDLNTSSCLTVLYDMLKDNDLNDATKRKLTESFDKVLSLDLLKEDEVSLNDELVSYIEEKIALRTLAKQNKDFIEADKIRNELLEKGILLKDTRERTIWNKR